MSTRLPGARYRRVFDRGRSMRGRLLVAWRVDRNRAKRLMREAFRLLVKSGTVPEHTEWVFVGRSSLAGKTVRDVVEDIAALCARLSGRVEPSVR